MGLFTRRQAASSAQLGAANEPAAHGAGVAAVEALGRDGHRDELATVPDAVGHADGRRFRLGAPSAGLIGPATETDRSIDPAAHTHTGNPDARRVAGVAGYAGSVDTTTRAPLAPEQLVNVAPAVDIRPQPAPTRPRAGLTGADPARTAVLRLWTFLRPFDKGMADQLAPHGVSKLERVSPLASVPIQHDRALPGALPTAGGSGATGMDPVGAQPNTYRLLPSAWDEYLVNTGPSAGSPVDPAPAARSGRTFRAS